MSLQIQGPAVAIYGPIQLSTLAQIMKAFDKAYPKSCACDGNHELSKSIGATMVLLPGDKS